MMEADPGPKRGVAWDHEKTLLMAKAGWQSRSNVVHMKFIHAKHNLEYLVRWSPQLTGDGANGRERILQLSMFRLAVKKNLPKP